MCTKPLHLCLSKYKHYRYASPVSVPCGDCDECRAQKANSIFVRAYYEYKACLTSQGNGFMCCLTYSDDVVPKLNIDGKDYMVFNKRDVILFLKRLRTNLSRYYQKYYHVEAPKFKYLVTSEYGTDPSRTHRPHYHLLFFFRDYMLPRVFRHCFRLSLYYRKNRFLPLNRFGYIMQCDELDSTRGGIQYSAKYVCKDITFQYQADHIKKLIKFKQAQINARFGISAFSSSFEEDLKNRLIRSRKDYKTAVEQEVRPYRHMLQFYMLSNDLGGSAYLDRYGIKVLSMPTCNINDFEYSLPQNFKDRIIEKYGLPLYSKLSHTQFLEQLLKELEYASSSYFISHSESLDLYEFAKQYVQPYEGELYLIYKDFDEVYRYDESFEELQSRFQFFADNDFFSLLERLQAVRNHYFCEENLSFRASVKRKSVELNDEKYNTKKRNNAYKRI